MTVTYRVDNEILYIAIEGRIDASNAAQAEETIVNIKNNNFISHKSIGLILYSLYGSSEVETNSQSYILQSVS